jgi:hypothetical protein
MTRKEHWGILGVEENTMPSPENENPESSPQEIVGSVSSVILDAFFVELGKDGALVDVAKRLRKAVLDDGVFAEAVISSALFPDGI